MVNRNIHVERFQVGARSKRDTEEGCWRVRSLFKKKKVRSVTDKQTDKTFMVRAPRAAESLERGSLVGSLKSCTEPRWQNEIGGWFHSRSL